MLGDCWWEDPVASDVHNTLRQKEKHIMPYHSHSPQINARRSLVDWLAVICDKIEVCVNARHLAIHLLDYFMDNFDIGPDKLQLVAFGSLLVASKFQQMDCQVSRWKTLNGFLDSPGYTSIEYMQMELMILEFFRWNITAPTAADFGPYYMVASMLDNSCPGDDTHGDYRRKAFSFLQKYMDYFLEISLQDYIYRFYDPSLVAAACVAASRICVRLVPTWPLCIEKLTSYNWEQVSSVVDFMLKALNADEESAKQQDLPENKSNCDSSPASSCSNHSLGSDGMGDTYDRNGESYV
ncbi:cyclin-J-like [Tubulanus polymorphus]|uniref:cyclin-J-like n=1 Tax=Tubulanus polymorphus TaxID=672921 RepID=UPI003DA33E19